MDNGLTSRGLTGRVLIDGAAVGTVLKLSAPICFWGGVDPATGRIADPHHPQFGENIAGRILAIPAIIGSSSSSQFLLELMRNGAAPAAILLGEEDAIAVTGAVVGREMGYGNVPMIRCDLEALRNGARVWILAGGIVQQMDQV